ncbi:MAG: response regulator [Alphaproteobacteria bacterium]
MPAPIILVVEDNRPNQVLIRTYVEGFGYRSALATGGAQALEFARNNVCDLVLMDIQMPNMDGVQATQAIRALGGTHQSLPIIALTASAGAQERAEFLRSGLDEVVTKPIDPEELLQKIARFVGAAPTAR